MATSRGTLLIGIAGAAVAASFFIAFLASWSGVTFAEALRLVIVSARPQAVFGWALITLLGVFAVTLRGRLSRRSMILVASSIICVAAVLVGVQEVLLRSDVDRWPVFGSETWRRFIAPLYAEHALTFLLAFGGVLALSPQIRRKRRA